MASPMDVDSHPTGKSAASGAQAGMKRPKIQRCSLAKAGEGDVVLVLKSEGKEIHVLMNAKILADVSSDFKEMLESNVSGRVPRSSKNPQELELPEDEDGLEGYTLLRCALYHGRVPGGGPGFQDGTCYKAMSHIPGYLTA